MMNGGAQLGLFVDINAEINYSKESLKTFFMCLIKIFIIQGWTELVHYCTLSLSAIWI